MKIIILRNIITYQQPYHSEGFQMETLALGL